MNSRPLLDYLAFPDDRDDDVDERMVDARPADPMQARLREMEARLRAGENTNPPQSRAATQDLTLSAQIEAILRRKGGSQPFATPADTAATAPFARNDRPEQPARVALEPPPSVPSANDASSTDQDFLRFTEAVYLIGQAAKRFIEQPHGQTERATERRSLTPSTGDIEALSAILRETVSAFRSVADDLAVSAGEIRHYATRAEREPRSHRADASRHSDEDEILELRETIASLQDRLDDLLHLRRRARY